MFKVSKNSLGEGQVQFLVEVGATEVDAALNGELSSLLSRMGIPTPEDKKPLDVISEIAGEENIDEFLCSALMNYFTPFVLTQEHVVPVVAPDLSATTAPKQGQSFSFLVTYFEKPQCTLSSYETLDITLAVPGPVSDEDLDNQMRMLLQTVQAQAHVEAADMVTLEQVTDEWVSAHFKDQGVETVEKLREAMLQAAESYQADQVIEKEHKFAMAAWSERLNEEPSEAMVEALAEDMTYSIIMELGQQKKTLSDYLEKGGTTEQEYKEKMLMRAKAALKESFAMDAIFAHENLEVTDEWLERIAKTLSTQDDAQAILKSYQDEGRMFIIRENAERTIAADWAMNHTHFEFEEE